MWYLKDLVTNEVIMKSRDFGTALKAWSKEYYVEEIIDHSKELKEYVGEKK